jgi:hypothetical protein
MGRQAHVGPARKQQHAPLQPGDQPDLADSTASHAGPRGEPEVRFEVTVVDGEAGRRLAALQAEAVLDVLAWLHEHRLDAPPSPL